MDQDFYDYAVAAAVPDDDFYYVRWEDPIYDVFEEYDYSGMCHLKSHKKTGLLRFQSLGFFADPSDRNRRLTGTNITVDYNTRPPQR